MIPILFYAVNKSRVDEPQKNQLEAIFLNQLNHKIFRCVGRKTQYSAVPLLNHSLLPADDRNPINFLILAFLSLSLFVSFPNNHAFASDNPPKDVVISIRATNEPLKEVLKKISQASGYEIRFNTQLADERVSLQLDHVTLNEALVRVLKPYNYMSLWDAANHIVTLLIFKKNSPPVTLSGMNRIFELATETTAGP